MRKKLELAVRIIVGLVILYFVLRKIDFRATWDILKSVNLFRFSIAIVAYFFFVLFSTIRWQILIAALGIKVSLTALLQSFLASIFMGNVLPSGAGLDVMRAFFLSRSTSRVSEAIASVAIDRITSFIGLLLIVMMGIPLGIKAPASYKYIAVGIAIAIAGTTYLLMVPPIHNLMEKISGKIPYGSKIMSLYQAFYEYRNHPSAILKAVLMTFLSQGALVIDAVICAWAIGYKIPITQALVYVPTINFIMIMPISIGGIGVREGSFMLFLSKIAHLMPDEAGFTVGVLYGLTAYIISLAGGFAILTAGKK